MPRSGIAPHETGILVHVRSLSAAWIPNSQSDISEDPHRAKRRPSVRTHFITLGIFTPPAMLKSTLSPLEQSTYRVGRTSSSKRVFTHPTRMMAAEASGI